MIFFAAFFIRICFKFTIYITSLLLESQIKNTGSSCLRFVALSELTTKLLIPFLRFLSQKSP